MSAFIIANQQASSLSTLGIGGTNDGQAPLQVFNDSFAVAESASITSTRNVYLSGNVATNFHRVFDGGMHVHLGGFTCLYASGTYGGTYINDTAAVGGTLTNSFGLDALIQADGKATITNANVVNALASVLSANAAITNLCGLYFSVGSNLGTITNGYGVKVDDFAASTLTAAFWTNLTAGTGKWGVRSEGTAVNFLRGELRLGNSTARNNGLLQFAEITTGSGTGIGWANDCELFRAGADTLRTPDALQIGTDVFLDQGAEVKFSATTAGNANRGRLGSSADGVLFARTSTSNPGVIRSGHVATTRTTDTTITVNECGGDRIHNNGATGTVILTLPAIPAGTSYLRVGFYVATAQELRVRTNSTELIQVGASVTTATTGYIQSSTVGDFVELEYFAGRWRATQIIGTWTVV